MDGLTDTTLDANAEILNFEGIDGGSGSDMLIGNSHGNTLMGGLGNDTLTGGEGSDIFVWRAQDLGGGLDMVTDFSFEQDDRLNFLDILETSGGTLDFGSARVTAAIDDGRLLIDLDGAQSISVSIEGSVEVQGQSYAGFDQFISAYEQTGQDQSMINDLL